MRQATTVRAEVELVDALRLGFAPQIAREAWFLGRDDDDVVDVAKVRPQGAVAVADAAVAFVDVFGM